MSTQAELSYAKLVEGFCWQHFDPQRLFPIEDGFGFCPACYREYKVEGPKVTERIPIFDLAGMSIADLVPSFPRGDARILVNGQEVTEGDIPRGAFIECVWVLPT